MAATVSGPLILNGTTRHVVILGDELATNQGRIVATTDEEKAALPGRPIPLPAEWVSVTEWLGAEKVTELARKAASA